MASGHVCSSFVDMDYRASHEIQHTYLTRAPTQPDAIRGTAGMSSVQGDHGGRAPGLG